jgi:Fuc2NAc and GlcNAc transferase
MGLLITILFFMLSVIVSLMYKKIATNNNIIAIKNHRTLHSLPTPKGGGIVFSLLFLLSFILIWWNWQLPMELFLIVGVGGMVASIFGFVDDIKNIRARVKLIVQIFLAAWVVYWLEYGGLLQLDWMPAFLAIPFLLFFMVWIINAYNFIDGIDGLAASGAIFISLTLTVLLIITNGPIEIMAIFILIVAVVSGFLLFNWPPATIFMGDAGSVFLGYIFGSMLLFTILTSNISIWSWLTVLGYFFADTTLTQIMRIVLVKKWYLSHRSHAYQNLARMTGSHLKVTRGVFLYNLIWVLPLTLLTAFRPEMGLVAATLAIMPALVLVFKYGPALSSS